MALPEIYTGENGQISIDTVLQTLADFTVTVSVDTIAVKEIGTPGDKTFTGKKHVEGVFEETLVKADIWSKMLGDVSNMTTSSLETLLDTFNLDAGAREEAAITTDPTDPTTVKVQLNVGDAVTAAGTIVIHGTDANGKYQAETINFDAMSVGDGTQTKYGIQVFETTDFVTIEAALESGAVSYSTLKIEGVSGVKTMTLSTGTTLFDLVGKVTEASTGKYLMMTMPDCFLLGGSFPVGDANMLVKSPMKFMMRDTSKFNTAWTSA